MALEGRVSIAFDANMLDADPDWTVIDTIRDNLVKQITFHDGRQSENETTEAGTCSVYINDTTGLFDRTNTGSPYFGKLDGKPIAIALWNPVDEEWVPQWRGTIESWDYEIVNAIDPNTGKPIKANVTIEAVGIFSYLGTGEMAPGVDGDTADTAGGTITYPPQSVKERIEDILEDAGIPDELSVVFTGNVNVQKTKYDLGDSYISALRDAADAEFPDIANLYEDKLGRVVFHGRLARFDPETTEASATPGAWDFNRWKAGDGTAIVSDPDCAQIREFSYAATLSRVVNKATAWPNGDSRDSIPDFVITDDDSIEAYGVRSWHCNGLIVSEGTTTGNGAQEECVLFASYQVLNLAEPFSRIERIVFKSVHPTDDRAESTWGLLTGISISDTIDVSVGYPEGTGIVEERYYVEGREMSITPLNPEFDMVVLSLNLFAERLVARRRRPIWRVMMATMTDTTGTLEFNPDDPELVWGLETLIGLGKAATDRTSLLAEVQRVSRELGSMEHREESARRVLWLLFATGRTVATYQSNIAKQTGVTDRDKAFEALELALYEALRKS